MSLLNDKFQLVTKDSMPGAMSGIWDSLPVKEIADAQAAGSGAGVADATGTKTLGAIPAGRIMELNTSFQLVDGNSLDITSNFEKMYWVVFEGTQEFSATEAGLVTAVHGGCRIETTQFAVGPSYTPGTPLIAVSGQLSPKASANDNIQKVGYVASGVNSDGVLDAYLVQG